MYTEKLQLPSRGKSVSGRTHVNYRQPTIDEIRRFLAFTGRHSECIRTLLNELVEGGINDLPLRDRDFIFVNVRRMVNPDPIEASFICVQCGTAGTFVLPYSEIKTAQLPDDFVDPTPLPMTDGTTLLMSVETVESEDRTFALLDLKNSAEDPSKFPHSDLGDDYEYFLRIANQMSGDLRDINSCIQFLRDLDFADFRTIMLWSAAFDFGPRLLKVTECHSCKKPHEIEVPINGDLLGLSLDALLSKHRFLAKSASIGYSDFLKYTNQEMEHVVEKEIEQLDKQKNKAT